jgi:trimethylamine---corrinoid protein Co-methyltransferase
MHGSLKFLSDEDMKSMHEATLQVMSEVGVIWTHKPSLDILTDAGCTMNGNRVCFPPDLVMDSIAKANKRPSIRGRNGQVNSWVAGICISTISAARAMCSMQATGTRHVATEEDACNAIRLLDALPNCHTVTPFFTPPDVSNELMAMHMYRHALSEYRQAGPGTRHSVRA